MSQLEARVNELNVLLKLRDEEKKHIQDLYSNEMKNKLELNNRLIANLKSSHAEEIKNIRNEYESTINSISKNSQQETNELKNKIINLEKDLILSSKKNDLNEKAEILEFQKNYITEMQELQKSFEEFKVKTNEEIKILRKQKEEATKKLSLYQQSFDRIKIEWEQNENIYRENYRSMRNKLDSFKIFIKNNEILKNQLDLSRSEIAFLKLKITKLESSEKKMQNILMEKSNFVPNHGQNFSDAYYAIDSKSNFFNNKSNAEFMNLDALSQYQTHESLFSPQAMLNPSIPPVKRSHSKSIYSHPSK